MSRRALSAAAVLTVVGAGLFPSVAQAAACSIELLPTPAGSESAEVTGIVDADVLVGTAYGPQGGTVGVVWRDGVAEVLPDFVPSDVNADGLMAGSVNVNNSPTPALRPVDGETRLLAPGRPGYATGVNDRGDVVGRVDDSTVLWPAAGSAARTLTQGSPNGPVAIDDDGLVLSTYPHTVLRSDDTVVRRFGTYAEGQTWFDFTDIDDGKLAVNRMEWSGDRLVMVIDAASGRGVPMPESSGGHALDIENGRVAGYSWRGPSVWQRTGVTLLPVQSHWYGARALTLDADASVVAGVSWDESTNNVATVWHCG